MKSIYENDRNVFKGLTKYLKPKSSSRDFFDGKAWIDAGNDESKNLYTNYLSQFRELFSRDKRNFFQISQFITFEHFYHFRD
jgi:hypothetical protein